MLFEERDRVKDLMRSIDETISESGAVLELMDALPTKLRHAVMVPLGSQALMPGYLIHTNEVMMQLGGDFFVSRTTSACKASLQRRVTLAEQAKAKLLDAVKHLDIMSEAVPIAQSGAPSSSSSSVSRGLVTEAGFTPGVHITPEGYVEIVEQYESDDGNSEDVKETNRDACSRTTLDPKEEEEAPAFSPSHGNSEVNGSSRRVSSIGHSTQRGGPDYPVSSPSDADAPGSRPSKFKQQQMERRRK